MRDEAFNQEQPRLQETHMIGGHQASSLRHHTGLRISYAMYYNSFILYDKTMVNKEIKRFVGWCIMLLWVHEPSNDDFGKSKSNQIHGGT